MNFPPIPENTPVIVRTSNSPELSPEECGIDSATQWWCESTRLPRRGHVRACVFAPGSSRYVPLIALTMLADDHHETDAAGHYALRITRALMRCAADMQCAPARQHSSSLEELKSLIGPSSPLMGGSEITWPTPSRWIDFAPAVLNWLNDLPALSPRDVQTLELGGRCAPVELLTAEMAAELLGYTGPSAAASARRQLSRWGIKSVTDCGGLAVYPADLIEDARKSRPGSGRHGAPRGEGGRFTTA